MPKEFTIQNNQLQQAALNPDDSKTKLGTLAINVDIQEIISSNANCSAEQIRSQLNKLFSQFHPDCQIQLSSKLQKQDKPDNNDSCVGSLENHSALIIYRNVASQWEF